MATLATINNRLLDASSVAELSTARNKELNQPRQLPNEDVYFYSKAINNANVIRESDPQASRTCWSSILGTFLAAFMLTGLLLPGAYSLFAGYQIEALRARQEALRTVQSNLDLEIAKLLSPDRLEKLARKQEMAAPAADRVVYLDPKADDTLSASLKQ